MIRSSRRSSRRTALPPGPALFTRVRVAVALFAFTCLPACSPSPPETAATMASPEPSSAPGPAAGDDRLVTLVDRGFGMPRGTQRLPRGWTISQDIATDPATGLVARYRVDYRGPRGEQIRSLGVATYNQATGQPFEPTWRQLALGGLQDVNGLSVGALRRSAALERLNDVQKAVQRGRQQGIEVELLEAPFRAHAVGGPVEGAVYVMHLFAPQFPGSGTVQAEVVWSPASLLAETVRLREQIANSFQLNPEYERRQQQVFQSALQRQQAAHEQWMANSRQWMAQSQAQHAQRMAANRAQFDAHQQRMQDGYTAADRQHAQFMEGLRGSTPGAASGTGYTGHEAFIDQLYERTTFQDPATGFPVHQDGQYDHWYTNGRGDYYGTDDPNFNPGALGTDWQTIEPLRRGQ